MYLLCNMRVKKNVSKVLGSCGDVHIRLRASYAEACILLNCRCCVLLIGNRQLQG